MFTVYIDDSGTDPAHHIAIASGLIIPAVQVPRLDSEWATFLAKEAIPSASGFHTSECVARNHKSAFAAWDEKHVSDALKRIRQIIFKYSVQAFSMAINKSDFDAIIPDELRKFSGKHHYSSAVDHMCGFVRRWAEDRGVAMEYIFDMAGKDERREVDAVMEHAEARFPGQFVGHYAFRDRRKTPALQCADLFAWTCYQQSQLRFRNRALTPIARQNWDDFSKDEQWCGAATVFPDELRDWVNRIYADPEELKRIRGLMT